MLKKSFDVPLEYNNENRLKFFTEWLPHPIVELDSSMNLIYLNKAARMQFPDLEASGKKHAIFKGLEATVQEILGTDSEIIVFERDLEISDLIFEQQVFGMPKEKCIYFFMTDTTKKRQAERARLKVETELHQAQKLEAIGQLTGGIAHDFNNILMIIQGNLQLLELESTKNGLKKPQIENALKAVGRGAELSKRLLAFARRENLSPSLISLDTFIEDIIKLLKPALGPSIELIITKMDSLWKIMADKNQLENAILNLMVNASHAMNEKGEIRIDINNVTIGSNESNESKIEPGDYLKISITDEGHGIASENLDKIFEPFFTTKEVGKGTGLGLSMVYGFMMQSNGAITVDSKLNKGTTFNLYFHRAVGEETTKAPVAFTKANEKFISQNKNILVVDDEEDLRQVLVAYLKQLGYSVLEAENGEKALLILKENVNVDLLLSDIAMPGKYNGIELASIVENIFPNLKIILTTADLSQVETKNKYEVLIKPYNFADLMLKLQKIFKPENKGNNGNENEKQEAKKDRLLIIDDDQDICALLSDVAKMSEFEVATASHIEKLAKAYNVLNPTLIILDLNLSSSDGVEILRVLRDKKCSCPIVILSGCNERIRASSVRLGLEYGLKIKTHLPKPADVLTILKLLQESKI